MMKPTDEQLRDPKWWDENAPEAATHFIDPTGTEYDDLKGGKFCEQMGSGAYWILPDRQRFWPDSKGIFCIPRPTKPAAPEWDGEGLPPVGCECEYRPDPETRPDWWEKCRYLAHCNEEYFVLMNHNIGVDRMNDSVPAEIRFRPVITKEQRDRGELLEILYMDEPLEVRADAIIAAGWTKS